MLSIDMIAVRVLYQKLKMLIYLIANMIKNKLGPSITYHPRVVVIGILNILSYD